MAKLMKCMNCGSDLSYSPVRKKLVCRMCGSNFPVEGKSGEVERHVYSFDYDCKNLEEQTQYECPACGTKIYAGREKPLGICASCGNTNLEKRTHSVVPPDGLIPFEISKEQAGEIFMKFVKTRKFAPSDLSQMARSQKIIGVYNPVWKFDFEAHVKYSYLGVKRYVDKYDHEQEKYYPERKTKEERYDNILLSGNAQVNDETLSEIGNYDFSKTVPYSSEYVLGFYLTDTNRDIHKVYDSFKDNLKDSYEKEMKKRVCSDFDSVENFVCRTNFEGEAFEYIGVPIWANHYTYKGKNYHCYINGQTGKFFGSSPKSFWKIFGTVCASIGALGALVLILMKLF